MISTKKKLLSLVFLSTCAAASATEPLVDQITVGDQKGIIYPIKCCWVELPRTDRMLNARRAAHCSAIGGPVGEFKYEDGKLWLVGLYRCSGSMPLQEVYPELENPALTGWLSGQFKVKLNWLCRASNGAFVFEKEMDWRIDKGVIVSTSETTNDKSSCER